ncbi:MAG: ABC transporter ATP-binding protein [Pseudomonadota bacterium]|nr:ABC transporter ATP-binding protein [Pseudomonadota bacterium]
MIRLEAKNLQVKLGKRLVIRGINFEVNASEIIGLLGPNASGKTTLLRTLAGLLSPATGEILLDGVKFEKIEPNLRARSVAYLAQGAGTHWPLTVHRLVTLGRTPYLGPLEKLNVEDEKAVKRASQNCDIVGLSQRSIAELSGGEQARVMLARAIATEPRVLLADEPVSHLDPYHQLRIMELLRMQANEDRASIVVLHDLSLAAKFCDRLVILNEGIVAASGTPREVLNNSLLNRVFGIEAEFFDRKNKLIVVPKFRTDDKKSGLF